MNKGIIYITSPCFFRFILGFCPDNVRRYCWRVTYHCCSEEVCSSSCVYPFVFLVAFRLEMFFHLDFSRFMIVYLLVCVTATTHDFFICILWRNFCDRRVKQMYQFSSKRATDQFVWANSATNHQQMRIIYVLWFVGCREDDKAEQLASADRRNVSVSVTDDGPSLAGHFAQALLITSTQVRSNSHSCPLWVPRGCSLSSTYKSCLPYNLHLLYTLFFYF